MTYNLLILLSTLTISGATSVLGTEMFRGGGLYPTAMCRGKDENFPI